MQANYQAAIRKRLERLRAEHQKLCLRENEMMAFGVREMRECINGSNKSQIRAK
jgi:hypothetical protein